MEEKSTEIPETKEPLREQGSIRALLELLEQQGMEQEKGDVILSLIHICYTAEGREPIHTELSLNKAVLYGLKTKKPQEDSIEVLDSSLSL